MRAHPAVVVPGSYRHEDISVVITWLTIQCGCCGHQFEVELLTYRGGAMRHRSTATCKACGRLASFGYDVLGATNVIPLRRPA